MTIRLNDKPYEADEGTTLELFTQNLGVTPHGIAIAIDAEIVPKNEWPFTVLADGMELTMVQAASGG